MPAEMTTTVHITAPIPGGKAVTTPLGALTVPVRDRAIAPNELRNALGDLLRAASDHLLGQAPDGFELASPGVGESKSPA